MAEKKNETPRLPSEAEASKAPSRRRKNMKNPYKHRRVSRMGMRILTLPFNVPFPLRVWKKAVIIVFVPLILPTAFQ